MAIPTLTLGVGGLVAAVAAFLQQTGGFYLFPMQHILAEKEVDLCMSYCSRIYYFAFLPGPREQAWNSISARNRQSKTSEFPLLSALKQ